MDLGKGLTHSASEIDDFIIDYGMLILNVMFDRYGPLGDPAKRKNEIPRTI